MTARNLFLGGIACLVVAAGLTFWMGRFGLRPAGEFKSEVVTVQPARPDIDVNVASEALVRSIIVEWKKKNPQP